MTVKEYISSVLNSDRIILLDGKGTEVFRGYAAILKYHNGAAEYMNCEIKQHKISTEVFRKEYLKGWLKKEYEIGEAVPVEDTGILKFADLAMMSYHQIELQTE